MKIITITLNPAYDIHYYTESVVINGENYIASSTTNPGGKGVNVSLALMANGYENHALVVVGKENGMQFSSLLNKSGLSYSAIETDGRVRENVTIHEKNGNETRLSLDNFSINSEILDEVFQKLDCNNETVVVFAGRLPKGIEKDEVIVFLKKIKNTGAKLVVDSNSFSLDELCNIKPWLIKPNETEICEMTNETVVSLSDALKVGQEIFEKGIANVLITMGEIGAVYSGELGNFIAKVPVLDVVSTVGAGDSTVAGFIAGVNGNLQSGEIVKNAIAFGSAACLTKGTNPPSVEKINYLKTHIKLTEIN